MHCQFKLHLSSLIFIIAAFNSLSGEKLPFNGKELETKVFELTKNYLNDFQDPKTGVLYNGRFSGKDKWTTPEECKAKKPHPWGYGSHLADTVLHCGHVLVAMMDANNAKPDPYLEKNIKKLFNAIKYIYESCPIPGIVPRGPHPDDRTAYYDDSSMDQTSTFIISLSLYANSKYASKKDKEFIKKSLNEVGARLEKYGWQILQADGKTQCHVGFHWTQMNPNGASILLPAVYALYKGTDNKHWLETYQKFSTEKDGKRWKLLTPGPHTTINGHPIYANQNCFRLNAFYQLLDDKREKEIIRALMKKSIELQLARDFPGPHMRKFFKEEDIAKTSKKMNWGGKDIHGSIPAWKLFDENKIYSMKGKQRGIALLAHVRFPLGAFHMIMNSEDKELILKYIPEIWKMLNSVDLKKVYGGETNYIFTIVALHLYDFYFSEVKN
jgi:hypothetical protein